MSWVVPWSQYGDSLKSGDVGDEDHLINGLLCTAEIRSLGSAVRRAERPTRLEPVSGAHQSSIVAASGFDAAVVGSSRASMSSRM